MKTILIFFPTHIFGIYVSYATFCSFLVKRNFNMIMIKSFAHNYMFLILIIFLFNLLINFSKLSNYKNNIFFTIWLQKYTAANIQFCG